MPEAPHSRFAAHPPAPRDPRQAAKAAHPPPRILLPPPCAAIAGAIPDGGGDRVLAPRGNRPATHAAADALLPDPFPAATRHRGRAVEGGHGRIETRRRVVCHDIDRPFPDRRHPWPNQRFDVKHPRQEPSALAAHARICAGGAA